MNKKRRSEIKMLVRDFGYLKERLEKVLYDEEDAFDNMPENLQGSDRGSESESAIDMLNESNDRLEEIIELLGDI